MKKETGITLLVLVITIIVLLILAGITINAITGENGIIGNAGQAKEETEIANEKEIVEKATVQAMGNNKYGNIEESELQSELDKETGVGKTDATDIGDEFEVIFVDSNRYYIVDKDGNVEGEYPVNKDKNPGDFTIGEKGETLDGSIDHPYEISCIEDLVVLSNISRGKGNYIEDGEIKEATKDTFSGDTIILTKDLNFNSTVSYADLSMTWRYDEGEEAYVIDEKSTQNLRDLLIDKNGVGFVPICKDSGIGKLNVNGNCYRIQNLYENAGTDGGLFSVLNNATIKNIELVNVDITSSNYAGGITQEYKDCEFYNCFVSGNITGLRVAAIGQNGGGNLKVVNCCNSSTLNATTSRTGGLIGFISGPSTILNSYNIGKIISTNGNVSGLIGEIFTTKSVEIINSCSMGGLSSNSSQNFYTSVTGGMAQLNNCYYLDEITDKKMGINEGSMEFSRNMETVITNLNTYVEAHKNNYAVELYRWKLDSNGLPTFEK